MPSACPIITIRSWFIHAGQWHSGWRALHPHGLLLLPVEKAIRKIILHFVVAATQGQTTSRAGIVYINKKKMDKKHKNKLQETEADGNQRAIDLTFKDVWRLLANPPFLLLLLLPGPGLMVETLACQTAHMSHQRAEGCA